MRQNLEGQKFGRLAVIEYAGLKKVSLKKHKSMYRCICDCGNSRTVAAAHLKSGGTKSCGCLKREKAAENIRTAASRKGPLCPNFKHGHSNTDGQPYSPTYVSWMAMKQRCLDPNSVKWPKYGGANPPIKICDRWLGEEGFTNFLADLSERPPGTTLGRFHDVGDYQPSNVAWMTPEEQVRNWRPDRNPGACQKKAA